MKRDNIRKKQEEKEGPICCSFATKDRWLWTGLFYCWRPQKEKKKKITLINESLPFALRWHLFLFFPVPPGSGTIRATSCTLRSGTGWTSSALRRTAPGPRQSTSSTSSTSCRRGNRRTAARWWARPTSCWRATSPPASAVSPSSSRSSRPTSGATNSRACTTTSSSVSQGSGASGGD